MKYYFAILNNKDYIAVVSCTKKTLKILSGVNIILSVEPDDSRSFKLTKEKTIEKTKGISFVEIKATSDNEAEKIFLRKFLDDIIEFYNETAKSIKEFQLKEEEKNKKEKLKPKEWKVFKTKLLESKVVEDNEKKDDNKKDIKTPVLKNKKEKNKIKSEEKKETKQEITVSNNEKRKRGRPAKPKNELNKKEELVIKQIPIIEKKKGRGRPKKIK